MIIISRSLTPFSYSLYEYIIIGEEDDENAENGEEDEENEEGKEEEDDADDNAEEDDADNADEKQEDTPVDQEIKKEGE